MDDLLASASHLVSRAARHVGFALCDNPVAILQRIEFVALGGSRVLVVVISRGNQITQKVVDTGEEVRLTSCRRKTTSTRNLPVCRSSKCEKPCWHGYSRSAFCATSCWRAGARALDACRDAEAADVSRGGRRVTAWQ